jgi:hypothetical protein
MIRSQGGRMACRCYELLDVSPAWDVERGGLHGLDIRRDVSRELHTRSDRFIEEAFAFGPKLTGNGELPGKPDVMVAYASSLPAASSRHRCPLQGSLALTRSCLTSNLLLLSAVI